MWMMDNVIQVLSIWFDERHLRESSNFLIHELLVKNLWKRVMLIMCMSVIISSAALLYLGMPFAPLKDFPGP